MEHCHPGKIPNRFDMVVVVAAWTEEDDPGKVVVVVGKSRRNPGACNTCRTMTREVCLDAAPRAMVSIIHPGDCCPFSICMPMCQCYCVCTEHSGICTP